MNLETNLKIRDIVRWVLTIAFAAAGIGIINEGIVDYKVKKFAETAKEVSLASVLKNKPEGKWIKISDYIIDVRHRLLALPDKSTADDLHILVPLRVPGERDDAPIRFLFRMDEYSDDPITRAYDAYQDSGITVLDGEAIFAEIVPIEDLPGNVPNVIRNDGRVAKDAIVLFDLPVHKKNDFNFFAGGLLLAISLFLYWRIRRSKRKSKPTFS